MAGSFGMGSAGKQNLQAVHLCGGVGFAYLLLCRATFREQNRTGRKEEVTAWVIMGLGTRHGQLRQIID